MSQIRAWDLDGAVTRDNTRHASRSSGDGYPGSGMELKKLSTSNRETEFLESRGKVAAGSDYKTWESVGFGQNSKAISFGNPDDAPSYPYYSDVNKDIALTDLEHEDRTSCFDNESEIRTKVCYGMVCFHCSATPSAIL
jgi:hypothetical protein